ncbi:MAG: T9SS type A sorting domain-containing protein, partial [Bacteroidota bacterium]
DLDAIGVIHQFDPTSTREQNIADVKVFPNPVRYGQEFYLEMASTWTNASFQILDVMGKVALQGSCSPNLSIQSQDLGKGLYFLRIRQNKQVISLSKIVIQ